MFHVEHCAGVSRPPQMFHVEHHPPWSFYPESPLPENPASGRVSQPETVEENHGTPIRTRT